MIIEVKEPLIPKKKRYKKRSPRLIVPEGSVPDLSDITSSTHGVSDFEAIRKRLFKNQ